MKMRYLIPLLIASMLSALHVSAYDFKVDGIYYNILDADAKTVEVTHVFLGSIKEPCYSGVVIIPEIVVYADVEYSVSSIEDSAFEYCDDLTEVTIPNSVISIGYRTFYSCF